MLHEEPTEQDRNRCLLVARYERINRTTWGRGKPPHFMKVSDQELPEEFATPQVREISSDSGGSLVLEVRVFDPEAVDFNNENNLFLGNWEPAAERCDAALRKHYPGTCIIEEVPFPGWPL